jgi:cytochrome c-type biogenesis protein CcmH
MSALARAFVLALLLAIVAGPAAALEPRAFDSAAQETRYRSLLEQLRCLVCQNETLADSHADLAKDLRNQIYTMMHSGASNKDITDFLVARYGDFVLYRPPVEPRTWLLWFGPFAAGAGGVAVLLLVVLYRRRRAGARPAPELDASERRRLADLLDEHGSGRGQS